MAHCLPVRVVKKVRIYSFFISSKNTPNTTTHAPLKDPTSVHATRLAHFVGGGRREGLHWRGCTGGDERVVERSARFLQLTFVWVPMLALLYLLVPVLAYGNPTTVALRTDSFLVFASSTTTAGPFIRNAKSLHPPPLPPEPSSSSSSLQYVDASRTHAVNTSPSTTLSSHGTIFYTPASLKTANELIDSQIIHNHTPATDSSWLLCSVSCGDQATFDRLKDYTVSQLSQLTAAGRSIAPDDAAETVRPVVKGLGDTVVVVGGKVSCQPAIPSVVTMTSPGTLPSAITSAPTWSLIRVDSRGESHPVSYTASGSGGTLANSILLEKYDNGMAVEEAVEAVRECYREVALRQGIEHGFVLFVCDKDGVRKLLT